MSIQAMSRVMEHSTLSGTSYLVLLVIANHEGDKDGETWAWPSIDTLARESRTSRSSVIRALQRAEEAGELVVQKNAGPRGVNLYRVASESRCQSDTRVNGTPQMTPELKELGSTVSTYNSSSTELKSCAPSSRDELFEALYLVQTGEKYTAETRISPRERGKINKARAELKAAGYSGADILAAIPGWTIAMGDLNITALGLSGNMRRCLNAAAGAVFRQEVQRETVEDRALKLVREHMAEEERRAIEIGEVLT